MTWLLMWHLNPGEIKYTTYIKHNNKTKEDNSYLNNYYLVNKKTKEELGPFILSWGGQIKQLTEKDTLYPKKYIFYKNEIVTIKNYGDSIIWDDDALKRLEELDG